MTTNRKSHLLSLIFTVLVAGAVYLAYQAREDGLASADGVPSETELLSATDGQAPLPAVGEAGPAAGASEGSASESSSSTGSVSDPAGNLIVNGGFEQPALTAAGYTPPRGWTSQESDLDIWLSQDSGSSAGSGIGATEGRQFLELNGRTANVISQEIEVVSGQTYRWSFEHRARIDQDTVKVLIDGESVTDATSLPGLWRTASGLFVVPDGQRSVTFAIEAIDEGDSGNFIDDVRFEVQTGL